MLISHSRRALLLIPMLLLLIGGCAKVEVDPEVAAANEALALPPPPVPFSPPDCDADGLSDDDEVLYGTQKDQPDSDMDGLNDGTEVNSTSTDPLRADTDIDGLTDGAEVRSIHTDPLKADTDAGGETDGQEVSKGKNPLLSTDDYQFPVVYSCN